MQQAASFRTNWSQQNICVQTVEIYFGAGEESRTLDIQLGKLTLYRLSYSRIPLEFSDLTAFVQAQKKNLEP
jgi:hypothetical protein